jgi:hypothetical protein
MLLKYERECEFRFQHKTLQEHKINENESAAAGSPLSHSRSVASPFARAIITEIGGREHFAVAIH